ncbi:aminotransferase class I/II-fold pyridoxal phosphate-dependent enzyme [Bavariicoccus seileri]|uniref:aminotransferase class I/II-fold pyridoxal phosphate-dependent enzyme n=1 Tax=Bavariicoccus seileri TaxID=549685 RepID=UPI003F90343D
MYGVDKVIKELVRNDYADHLLQFDPIIYCSLGSNPWGGWPGLVWHPELFQEIGSYPHAEDQLKKALVSHYQDIADLTTDHIRFGGGSVSVIYALNRLFLSKEKVVIGVAPQFTAAIDDFHTYSVRYEPVFLKAEDNYQLKVADLLTKIARFPGAYVYLDNPNNPTGQTLTIEALESIVAVAQEQGSFVIIDEAYGDYLELDTSAMSLVNQYDNLAVFRTFSKGFGELVCGWAT